MSMPAIRPAILLAPCLAGPLAFGAWEKAQCKLVVNRSPRTLCLTLCSIDPPAKAGASRLGAGPGEGVIVPLEPQADAKGAGFALGPFQSALVYVDQPEGAAPAAATFRLADQAGKPLAKFQFKARWSGGSSRLKPLEQADGERAWIAGDVYTLQKHVPAGSIQAPGAAAATEAKVSRPAAAAPPGPGKPDAEGQRKAVQVKAIKLDQEDILTGTLSNQSSNPWRLSPVKAGGSFSIARTDAGEAQVLQTLEVVTLKPGQSLILAQPLRGFSTADNRNKGCYLLQDLEAGTQVLLAWGDQAYLELMPPVEPGARQVQARESAITILRLDAGDQKAQAPAEAPKPEPAPAGAAAQPGALPAGQTQRQPMRWR